MIRRARLACLGLLGLALACDGGRGPRGRSTGDPVTPTVLTRHEEPPELRLVIEAVRGASGPAGRFQPGDSIEVVFELTKADGSPWRVDELVSAEAMLSGPTFSYQRVLPARDDVAARARRVGPGRYRYRFADTLPRRYAAPYNDTSAFGRADGELTGEVLLAGTYTVGLSFAWRYTVEGRAFLRVGEATAELLVGGGAGAVVPRAVSQQANCDRCHVELEAHAGRYRSFAGCVLCHTAGAEDPNDPAVAGGTPGVTIAAPMLFHRLHNGAHLPSVVGIGVTPGGARDYGVAPRPYLVADGAGGVSDFSTVGFPAWPNRLIGMPRDVGYDLLGPLEQALEDRVRTGVTACALCHGDPDGGGPLTAPAQGDLFFAQMSRGACGDCHDDIDWSQDYIGASGQVMPPQPDDSQCIFCHDSTFGGPLAVTEAHQHPLLRRDFTDGLALEVVDVREGQGADGDGRVEVGEGLTVSFAVRDELGQDLPPGVLDELRVVVSGPTTNQQLLLDAPLVTGALGAGPLYTADVLARHAPETLGRSTAAAGESFTTARAPHADAAPLPTEVFVQTGLTGVADALASAVAPPVNHVDLVDASGFARDDVVVLNEGVPGLEEALRVQFVEGDRLWFSSPASPAYGVGPARAHAPGAQVRGITVRTATRGVDYTLDALTGTLTEVAEFGPGALVLASYGAPLRLPAVYPVPLHDSPDRGEVNGEWQGKALVDGTYRLGLLGWYDAAYPFGPEPETYRIASAPAVREFLVGPAATLEPYARIEDGARCNACHVEPRYHAASYRGFDACLLCHGTAGAEDRPPYVSAAAPPTTGVGVDFRELLHRIHRGVDLADPGFLVVGQGPGSWPVDVSFHFYGEVRFPARPGRTTNCAVCHGPANEAWKEPGSLDHPFDVLAPARTWTGVCLACHDAPPAAAHAAANTAPSGAESCAVCHGRGGSEEVELVHRPRSGG